MSSQTPSETVATTEHTEIVEMPGRGHTLTIDSGWREVADAAPTFVRRFTHPQPAM